MATAVRKTQPDVGAQDYFVLILPEVARLLRWCFRHEDRDRREELVQDALCRCWAMYVRAHERGKVLAAHGLAWYGWLGARAGRKFCGESNRTVEQWVSLESLGLNELLAADWKERWPVADQVAFRLDWPEFCSRRDAREARAISLLAVGHRRSDVAEIMGVSPSWVTQFMKRVREDWEEFTDPETRHPVPLSALRKW